MRPRMTRPLLLGLAIAIGAACTSPPATNGPHVGSSSALASGTSPEPAVDLPEVPADKREQTLAEIAMVLLPDRHLLRRPIDDALGSRREQMTWRYECQHVATAVSLVAEGLGIAVLPRLSIDGAGSPGV